MTSGVTPSQKTVPLGIRGFAKMRQWKGGKIYEKAVHGPADCICTEGDGKPRHLSDMNISTPTSPLSFRYLKKALQLTLSSLAPPATPRISRYNSLFTHSPLKQIHSLPLRPSSASMRSRPGTRRNARLLSAAFSTSRFFFISLHWDFEIVPGLTLLPNKASVMSSYLLTETPAKYISKRASSTEGFLHRYRWKITVSKGSTLNFRHPDVHCSCFGLKFPRAMPSPRILPLSIISYRFTRQSLSAPSSSGGFSVSSGVCFWLNYITRFEGTMT